MSIVISDIKNPYTTSGSITNWTYLADIRNISNMYPYGKSYPAAATYNADDDYRYGFNGMEKEKNFDSDGDVADFGARIFDANYPVFLSRDPKSFIVPFQSSYIFAGGNPISYIDLNGELVHLPLDPEEKAIIEKALDNNKILKNYLNNVINGLSGEKAIDKPEHDLYEGIKEHLPENIIDVYFKIENLDESIKNRCNLDWLRRYN